MGEKNTTTLSRGCETTNSSLHLHLKDSIIIIQKTIGICALVGTVLLAACSPSTSIPTPTLTPSPAATSTPQQTGTPNPLDPCILLPPEEASALAGASFGTGEEGTTPGGGLTCTYGSQTTNVFFVEVALAPSVDAATAYKTQFMADIQANLQQLAGEGLTITELPDFLGGAVIGQATINAGGQTIHGSAIGVLKGTLFFGFSDVVVGGPAPSSEALQSEAQTVLEGLP